MPHRPFARLFTVVVGALDHSLAAEVVDDEDALFNRHAADALLAPDFRALGRRRAFQLGSIGAAFRNRRDPLRARQFASGGSKAKQSQGGHSGREAKRSTPKLWNHLIELTWSARERKRFASSHDVTKVRGGEAAASPPHRCHSTGARGGRGRCARQVVPVEPSRLPPSVGWPTLLSPITLTSAGLPDLKARSSAGTIWSGS